MQKPHNRIQISGSERGHQCADHFVVGVVGRGGGATRPPFGPETPTAALSHR